MPPRPISLGWRKSRSSISSTTTKYSLTTTTTTTPTTAPTTTATTTTTTTTMPASSYEDLQEGAGMPPATIPSHEAKGRAGVVLFVFRVPGGHDLCISLAKPAKDQVTDLDVFLALYYVRAGADGSLVLVRRGQAVARVEGWVVEILAAGYLKFGANVKEGEPYLHVVVGKDHKGVSGFLSPWGTNCRFGETSSSMLSSGTIKCQHQVSGPGPTTISELKLKLKSKLLEKGRRAVAGPSHSPTVGAASPLPPPPVPPHRQQVSPAASSVYLESEEAVFGAALEPLRESLPEPATPPTITTTTTHREQRGGGGARIMRNSLISPLFAYRPTAPEVPPRRLPTPTEEDPGHRASDLAARPHHHLPALPARKALIRRKPVGSGNPQPASGDQSQAERQRDAAPAVPMQIGNPVPQSTTGMMGLALGREALGGGRRGKQATLAKLTVLAEGQYMLDLVVAANLVVFYDHYNPEE